MFIFTVRVVTFIFLKSFFPLCIILDPISQIQSGIKMSITDPHLSDCFNDKIEEIHNKLVKTFATLFDGATGIGQCHRQFVTSAVGMFDVLSLNFNLLFLSVCFFFFFYFSSRSCFFCLYFAFRYRLEKV